MAKQILRKSFQTQLLQLPTDAPDGSIACVFSTFNIEDKDGDVVLPGALQDGTPIRMCSWGHKWGELPVGKGVIRVTPEQALFEGQFFLQTEAGRETYETVKALGDLQEWSWGFSILPGGKAKGMRDGHRVNLISAVEPYEVSPVLVGSNPSTGTLEVKADDYGAPGGDDGGGVGAVQPLADAKAVQGGLRQLLADATAGEADSWTLQRLACAIGDLDCYVMMVGHDAVADLVATLGDAPDVAKVPHTVRALLAMAGLAIAEGATEEEHAAQEERSARYAVGVKSPTSVTRSGAWADLPDGEFGDPVNYRYPMPDLAHATNAADRFAANKDEYTADEQAVVGGRIEARQAELQRTAALGAATAAYADHGNGLLAGLGTFRDRTRDIVALRSKEGRVLSMANRQRLSSLTEAMRAMCADIDGLLTETEPQPKQAQVEMAARMRALAIHDRRARTMDPTEG